MDRSAGERRVAAEKDVVVRTVSVRWTLEVPRVAVSWAVPTDKPATVNVTSLELAVVLLFQDPSQETLAWPEGKSVSALMWAEVCVS